MISRLRYPQKFLLISLLFLLPLAVTMFFMVEEQNVRIRFARKEIAGAQYLRSLSAVYSGALRHRHEAMRALVLGIPVDAELLPARDSLDEALAALRPLDDKHGTSFGSTDLFKRVEATWAILRADPLTGDPLATYDRYEAFIGDLRDLIILVGDRSNLILDPDLDSYYIMDAVLLRLPEAQELIARMLLINEGLVPGEHLLADRRTELIMSASLLRSNSDALERNLAKAYGSTSSASLRPELDPTAAGYRAALAEMLDRYQEAADTPTRLLGTRDLVDLGLSTLDASRSVYAAASPALERLLVARIDVLKQRQGLIVAFVLLVVVGAFAAGMRMMSSISRPLEALLQATRRLADGDHDARVEVSGTSEAALVGWAFNGMAQEVRAGREHLEQRVAERTAELAEATREAQEARVAAEEATRAKSAFLANMSHELRTPLNAIIGYSEMLQEEATDRGYDDFTPDLEKIHTAGKHLLALINDILDLSKIEAGRMDLHLERFGLAAMLSEALATMLPMIEKNGNTIEVRGDTSGTVYADLAKLRQSLLNLLSNAAKFTEGGTISVDVDSQIIAGGEYLRLRVSDTGIGMSQEQLGKLFREFTQGDSSTTRKYGGTGLGLALSRRFCQMMGGDITVTSAPERGSTFTIVVPREVQPLAAPAGSAAVSPEADMSAADSEQVGPVRGTVLVIDDDPATHDLLRRTLAREGLRVVTATTGEEGLARARVLRPDVITLDVLLKGTDGWQILTAIKADPDLANIPVLMLTIMDERNTGFALGAADYLTKPIDRRRLVDLVGRYCARSTEAAGGADVLVIEDDAAVREILCRTMDQGGWSTRCAQDGRIGLERVAEQRPGLILLDLMMPELDGFGFLVELRRNPDWAGIPVIVVTAMDLSAEERSFLTSSVQRVLQKGDYERDTLLSEVRAAIAVHTQAPQVR
ncbi:MAG: response regulator [Chloroflexales bacterium]|nr:response regulator [Chloroflexales bacterium]